MPPVPPRASTNKIGFYSINGIPDGTYTVVVSCLGYVSKETALRISGGEANRLDVSLVADLREMEGVTVERNRMEDDRQIGVSRVNIPLKEMCQFRVGGEADVFRSLQFLLGVLASSQMSSCVYVRGGSPDQTLVLHDGSTVFNPSHLFGFYSTFNPDAIKDVELIKGGFHAEYGGRMSAVLDLVQRDGNRMPVLDQETPVYRWLPGSDNRWRIAVVELPMLDEVDRRPTRGEG